MKALGHFTTLLPMLSIGLLHRNRSTRTRNAGWLREPRAVGTKKGQWSGYEGEADQRWCRIEGARHCLQ